MLKKFVLIGGTHIDKTGSYQTGDIVKSVHDLTIVFPNKFRLVAEEEIPPVSEEKEDSEGVKTPSISENKPTKAETDKECNIEGEDITDQYELAKEKNVLVYKKGAWFNIYNKDSEELIVGPVRKIKVEKALKAM